jgi:lipid-A-disaccharide synthase-like uncharacterized protein
MEEMWRTILYPLGFLSSVAFGGRFILQWIESEKKGQSVVTRTFWQISLIGNISLVLHSIVQGQFHVCIAQACNGVISWRNLNLMQTKKKAASFQSVIALLAGCCALVIAIFTLQSLFFNDGDTWFRVPTTPWQSAKQPSLPLQWNLLGFLGYALFSSRFWIQWWLAENAHKSSLSLSFWWLSLIGSLASGVYFFYILDLVNLIGPVIGLVPYARNLVLMYTNKKAPQKI